MDELKIPKDHRAADLFAQLDRGYSDFTSRMPSHLSSLASLRNTYSGYPGEEQLESISILNPVLAATPWLFWDLFNGLEDYRFEKIAEAGMFFVLASVILDHLVDEQGENPQRLSLLHQALYQNAVSGFREALDSSSPYWDHFDRLAAKHLKGLSTEIDIQEDPQQLELEIMFTMAHGKVAPIVNTSAALAFASGQPELLEPIEASLNHISVASQLLDDIGDWEHDLDVRHMTYYLGQCAPPEVWQGGKWPTKEDIKAYIEAEWVDVKNMHLVADWLNETVESVEGINCPGWVEYVDGYRERADQHLTHFYIVHIGRALQPS